MEPSAPPEQRHPARATIDERLYRAFDRAEVVLTALVAIVLIGLAVLALGDTLVRVLVPLLGTPHDATTAITDGIDAAFLVIILLELLHTILSHGSISRQLQEFLAIGITAAVRHGLGLAASKADQNSLVIDLAINSGGVLLLVVALWFVRQHPAHLLVPAPARQTPADGAPLEAASPTREGR